MSIISFIDNETKRWKKNAEKNKDRKEYLGQKL